MLFIVSPEDEIIAQLIHDQMFGDRCSVVNQSTDHEIEEAEEEEEDEEQEDDEDDEEEEEGTTDEEESDRSKSSR